MKVHRTKLTGWGKRKRRETVERGTGRTITELRGSVPVLWQNRLPGPHTAPFHRTDLAIGLLESHSQMLLSARPGTVRSSHSGKALGTSELPH
jgi:hypothetical protein